MAKQVHNPGSKIKDKNNALALQRIMNSGVKNTNAAYNEVKKYVLKEIKIVNNSALTPNLSFLIPDVVKLKNLYIKQLNAVNMLKYPKSEEGMIKRYKSKINNRIQNIQKTIDKIRQNDLSTGSDL